MSSLKFAYSLSLTLLVVASTSTAATRTWIGGNDPWNGDPFNWTGLDEPDPDDDVVFNTDNVVGMANDNEILSLDLSGDITLDTNTSLLTVNGDITLSGAGTRLRAGENNLLGLPSTSVSAYNLTINDGATYMNANFTSILHPSSTGLVDINVGGTLYGNGTIRVGDGFGSPTVVFNNDGVIRPGDVQEFVIIGGTPPARTLTLSAIDGDARIDLDGNGGNGDVDIQRNQTLDIDIQLEDPFDGDIDLGHNSTLDIEHAWTFSGTMNVDNGFVPGQVVPFFIPAIPADVAYLQGGAITMSGSATTMNVLDGDGTLQIDALFTANGGTIANSGRIIFNQDATINSGVDFQMLGVDAGLTVGPGARVEINDEDFDFDGGGASTNEVIVEAGGVLDMNLDEFEGNDRADGFLTLNSGALQLEVADDSWTMERRLTLNNSDGIIPVVSGSEMVVGNDAIITSSNDADVRVTGNGTSQINAPVVWNSDAEVDVDAGATLAVYGFSTFNSVNGAESAQFDGPGNIYFSGGQVNEDTTLNFSGGTVGLDGGGGGFVILLGSPDFTLDAQLTINAAEIDEYGRFTAFPSPDSSVLTINNSVGGRLDVNLDNASDSWTVNSNGVMDINGNNVAFSTFLTGSTLNMQGTMNVDGRSRSTAQLIISGDVVLEDAATRLRLEGGDLVDANRLEGGTITGPGRVSIGSGHALVGYGTIDSDVYFYNTSSRLGADDGTLQVNGSFVGLAGGIGTEDVDGILEVTTPWNTNTAQSVFMGGGEIRGAAITNDGASGIGGHGLLSAPVLNNSILQAVAGTLTIDNPLNNNDWDGAGDSGQLRAETGDLVIRDNSSFLFSGSVRADAGRTVDVQGFALQFDSGSELRLQSGTYQSDADMSLGGAVNVDAGNPSTIAGTGDVFFANGSTTTLNGDLHLEARARVVPGAVFMGGATLMNTASNTLALNAGSDVGVVLQNDGVLQIADAGPGRSDLADFVQTASGQMNADLADTLLTQFDRLVLSGAAQLAGELDVDLNGGFAPVLGDTFTILTTVGGVQGTFDTHDFAGAILAAGLEWDVIYNPTNVQLAVVEAGLPGDFNDDGIVDMGDYNLWRDNLGDADEVAINGNGTGGGIDEDDYTLWVNNFGNMAPASLGLASSSAAVPEPTAAYQLLSLVALWTLSYARPRLGRTRVAYHG